MMHSSVRAALSVLLFILAVVTPAQARPRLVGWYIDHKNVEAQMARAEEVGFQVIYANGKDEQLAKAAEIGRKHGIEVYAVAGPGRVGSMQVVTPEEEAAVRFLSAGKNRYLTPYQWGGEPVMEHESLLSPIVCPNHREARAFQKAALTEKLSIPGIAGIAFDGFGYQNFRRCYCEVCEKGLAEFRSGEPGLEAKEAEVIYFRDLLVNWINDLAEHVRSVRPDAKTAIHVWPAFMPEPLYGNRLNVDSCGQTAAWYTLWTREKIAQYSGIISESAQAYHPRQVGAGMIGYYDRPEKFPVKDASLVDEELKTMLENGCREVQVCGVRDVLGNEPVAAVFTKYFGVPKRP